MRFRAWSLVVCSSDLMSPAQPAVAAEAISRAVPAVPKPAKIVRGIGSSSRLPEYKTQPQAESFLKLAGNVRRTERKSGRADASGPALQHLIGRTVAIGPGADVGDDLFAHRQPPLDGGRHHMRQQHDVSHREQPLVNGGLMLEHVEPGARDRKRTTLNPSN